MSTRRNVFRQLSAMPATAHPGLWFDRFVSEAAATAKSDTPTAKDTLFGQLEHHTIRPDGAYQRCYNQWKNNLSAVVDCELYTATTKGRCLVGLGAASVLDTGLALHHTYGYPYIAGSALKGLCAAYARLHGGPSWSVDSPAYLTLFGNQEESGVVDFLDAYWQPTQHSPFAADIMSVHQFKYYSEENHAPSDRETLNIVGLLSVGHTQHFSLPLVGPEAWRRAAAKLLSQALMQMGIGAKTNAGYGRMLLDIPLTAEEQQVESAGIALRKANEYIESVVKKIGPAQKGQLPAIVGKFLNEYKAGTYDTQSAQLIAAAFREKIKELQVSTANLWYPELQKLQ